MEQTSFHKEWGYTGFLRLATIQELDQIAEWIYHFFIEVGEDITKEDAWKKANMHIEASKLHLWDDGNGTATSMAMRSRSTRRGIVITLVYTPPEQRKKGYATSCVAELSRLLLGSNHIYQAIGYEPVSDSIVYSFHR
ncbi:GNAT family N-acetyltransferase [Brevibacillus sp. 179-C9.3 HS]|uniref:GNAT family N-acetyltransferase n=1 Tax=unclassified Brevibacillus TaxID=2684853 RepID=UPI0039A33A7D